MAYEKNRHTIGEPVVPRSTSGEEQHIFALISQLVTELQRLPEHWHQLIDPVLELKNKANAIAGTEDTGWRP